MPPVGTSFSGVEQVLRVPGSWRMVLEVQKDDLSWLDLSDRITHDKLVSMSGLSGRAERTIGTNEVTLASVVVDNSDHFWDGAPPTGISSWYRRKARVGVRTVETPAPKYLGTFLIEDIEAASDSPNVTVKLAGLSKRLSDKQADRTREGKAWFTNRPTGWLVQELLKQEFTRDEVAAWTTSGKIQNAYRIPVSDGARALSHYGRPPEWDGSAWDARQNIFWSGDAMCCIDDSGSAYHGQVLMGIESTLWLWDPATDLWTKVGIALRNIRHLFWNKARHHAVGVMWDTDKPNTGKAKLGGHLGNNTVKFFRALKASDGGAIVNYSASMPTGIVTGHWQFRVGGYFVTNNFSAVGGASTITGTSGDNNSFGVNVPQPFRHWQHWRQYDSGSGPPYAASLGQQPAWNDRQHDNGTPTPAPNASLEGTPDWGVEVPGYYSYNAVADSGNGDHRPMDHRMHLGSWKGAFAMQHAGDLLVFFVISYDSTNKRYDTKFRIFDTNADTVTDPSAFTATDGASTYQVHSAKWDPTDTYVYYCGSSWGENQWSSGVPAAGAHPDGAIYRVTVTSSTVTSSTRRWWNHAFTSGQPEYYLLPLEFEFGDAGTWIAATFFDYSAVNGNAWSVALLDTTQIVTAQMSVRRASVGQPKGLLHDPSTQRIYWIEAGPGTMFSVPDNDNTVQPTVEDFGNQPVAGDGNLMAGLVYDPVRQAIYGLSGVGISAESDENAGSQLIGKFYLWQFDDAFTDRIELADFSDMTIWDAMIALGVVGDFLFGFDENGDFYFKPRSIFTAAALWDPATTPRIIVQGLTESDVYFHFNTLKLNKGYKEVYNVAEITPSIAVLGEAEGTAHLVERPVSTGTDTEFTVGPWHGRIQAAQRTPQGVTQDTLSIVPQTLGEQNVFLRCRQGSLSQDDDDGIVRADRSGNVAVDFAPGGGERLHKLRFAFLVYDRVVETQAVEAINNADDFVTVPIESAKDISFPTLAGASSLARGDIIRIADQVERIIVSYYTDPLTGTAVLSLDSAVGVDFPAFTKCLIRSKENNRWSDDPVGVAELYYSVAGAPASGTVETMEVTDSKHFPRGMVMRIVDELGFEEVRVLGFADAASPSTLSVVRGVGGTTPYDHSAAATPSACLPLWAPIENTDWPPGAAFAVGGVGVDLLLDIDIDEQPWMVGDEIDIVCPGLKLEEQEGAKAISFNQDSIVRFGKIPFPAARDTRFLGFRQAIEVTRRSVSDFGLPHFPIAADGPFCMIPTLLRPVYVMDLRGVLPLPKSGGLPLSSASPNGDDPAVAPDLAGRAIACYVRGYTVNPYNDTMSLDLRAVNPHVY